MIREISNVKTLVDTNGDGYFQRQNLKLIQTDD